MLSATCYDGNPLLPFLSVAAEKWQTGGHMEVALMNRSWMQSHSFTGRHVKATAVKGSWNSAPQSDRCRLDLGGALNLRMASSRNGHIAAEQVADDVDTGEKRPPTQTPAVSAVSKTSFEAPFDIGEHQLPQSCITSAQKSSRFHGIKGQQARNVIAVASGFIDLRSDHEIERHSPQRANESTTYGSDANSSFWPQVPKMLSDFTDGGMPTIMNGRVGDISALRNQCMQVECVDDGEYDGFNVSGVKDSLTDTRASNDHFDGAFEGFQLLEAGNNCGGTRSIQYDSNPLRLAPNVTGHCEEDQTCTRVGDIDAVVSESYKQDTLIKCAEEGQDPAMPNMVEVKSVVEPVNSPSNQSQDPALPSMVEVKNVIEPADSPSNVVVLRMPFYHLRAHLEESVNEIVCYLEDLGVDYARILKAEPRVKACTVKQIKAIVSNLEGHGLTSTDVGRVFLRCPKVLLLDWEKDIKLVTDFLFYEAGLSQTDFCKVIRRCPRLLIKDPTKRLRPTLNFLHTLGYTNMGHAIANNPALLSYDVNTRILPRLRLLESWGFTYREAAWMAVRFPALFNYSAAENLQRKYDYLSKEIGASKKDLLAFPQYFGFSLEHKIQPRYLRIAKLNVSLSLHDMLTLPEFEFSTRFLRDTWLPRHDLNKDFSKSLSSANPDTEPVVSV